MNAVHHLNCGSIVSTWPRVRGVIHCLLVETSDGLLLVDTGFGTRDYADPTPLMRIFRASMHSDDPAEAAVRQIARLGREPADVRHIVLTHLHLDHAGGLPDFPQAQIHIFAPEYAAAMRPRRPVEWFYDAAHWAHGPDWVIHRLEGETWFGFDALEVVPGLTPRVFLVPLTGHTRGHCAVAVETNDGWLLHYGDGGYPFYNAGKSQRLFSNPPLGLARWFLGGNTPRLEALYRAHGDEVTLISSHDPADFQKFHVGKAQVLRGRATTRADWEIEPLPDRCARLDFQRNFSETEYARLTQGLIPQQMEDKWFIFFEDNTLYFHRSWTGICIYVLRLEPSAGGWRVIEVLVNRDPDQYTETNEAYDIALLNYLIDRLLLGKDLPFPVPGDIADDVETALYRHHVVGHERANDGGET